jgi:outer membrane protein assembly factor BamB
MYALDREGHEVWRFETGAPIRSSPLLAQGLLIFGSGDGHLYALDQERGKEMWRFPQEESLAAIYSTPWVAQETLYFTSYEGKVYALRVEDGSPLWEPFEMDKEG